MREALNAAGPSGRRKMAARACSFIALAIFMMCAGETTGSAVSPCRQIMPLGPFFAAEYNPLYELFLLPEPRSALRESAGFAVDLQWYGASIFERDVRKDFAQRFDLERYGMNAVISNRSGPLELGVKLGGYYNSQGVFDGLINEFHSTFGLNTGGRENAEDHVYSLILENRKTGSTIYHECSGYQTRNPVIFAVYRLDSLQASAHAFAATFDFQPSLVSRWKSYVGQQASIGLLYGFKGESYALNMNVSAVTINANGELSHYTSSGAGVLMAALERRIRPRCNVAVQIYYASRYLEIPGVENLAKGPLTFSAGILGRTKRGCGYQLSFSEDISSEGPSVDIALNLGVSWGR